MARPVLLAVTSDQHVCSTVGLCPPEGVKFDEGGRYTPSKAQLWLWDCWQNYWNAAAAWRREAKAKLVCVFNGDATDGGAHHGTLQTISADPEVQGWLAERVFNVPRGLKPAAQYMVRGTPVHVGGDTSPAEAALARYLGCVRDPETDAWAFWHLRLNINSLRLDCQHHGRMGTRPWTQYNVVLGLAAQIRMEYDGLGQVAPDLAFRSHQHRFADSGNAYRTRVIQTPAFQLSTAFVHRVSPETLADVGGVLCLVQPDGSYEIRVKRYRPDLPTEFVL